MKKMSPDEVLELADAFNVLGPSESRTLQEVGSRLKLNNRQARRFLSALGADCPARLRVALNYSKLPVVTTAILLKAANPAAIPEMTNAFAKSEFMDTVFELCGNATHLLLLRLPASDFAERINYPNVIERLPGKIRSSSTVFAYRQYFEDGIRGAPEGAKAALDERDWLTLRALYNDANRTLDELAAEVGVKKPSLHRRLKQLRESGVVRGYDCELQYGNLPPARHPLSFVFAMKVAAEEEAALADSLIKNYPRNIGFLYRTHGEFDVLMSVRFRELSEYRQFLSSGLGAFKSVRLRSFLVVQEKRGDWLYDNAMRVHTEHR
ncbi:MAG: Lrp/AsnC family transcriptional regulator [Candidatus Micrarchaeota archaeon]